MKKHLLFAALASAALVSCVNDEDGQFLNEEKAPQPITFNTPITGMNTRTVYGEMASPYSKEETFNVWGLVHTGNYTGTGWGTSDVIIDDVTVKYNATLNGWETDGHTYFWPDGKMMTFCAYSPTQAKTDVASNSGTIKCDDTGITITNFKVSDDTDKQYDLMYSEVARNKNSSPTSSTGGYNGVDLNFHHALSSVNFYVKLGSGVSSGSVKDIKVNNVKNSGTFKQGVVWNSETLLDHTQGKPKWEQGSSTQSYVVLGAEQAASSDPVHIGDDMILLPQSLSDEATITLSYKLGSNPWTEHTIQINELTAEWLMAKRYNYTIILGGSGVTQIYFAPNVIAWSNADSDVNVP